MTELTRTAAGHFVPGHAVKSPGRPRGQSASEAVRELLEPHRVEVVNKIIELSKLGDPQSQKLFMQYLAPAPKQESERIEILGLSQAPTPAAKADCILAAVADGAISFEAGERALRMLHTYMTAITTTDHEARLAALEDGKSRLAVLEAEQKAQLEVAAHDEDADSCDLA